MHGFLALPSLQHLITFSNFENREGCASLSHRMCTLVCLLAGVLLAWSDAPASISQTLKSILYDGSLLWHMRFGHLIFHGLHFLYKKYMVNGLLMVD